MLNEATNLQPVMVLLTSSCCLQETTLKMSFQRLSHSLQSSSPHPWPQQDLRGASPLWKDFKLFSETPWTRRDWMHWPCCQRRRGWWLILTRKLCRNLQDRRKGGRKIDYLVLYCCVLCRFMFCFCFAFFSVLFHFRDTVICEHDAFTIQNKTGNKPW